MYEDDTPPAERRAQALSLDRDLLRELLGQEELRDLLDPDALEEVEAQLRGAPRNADELHDLLRLRGDLRAGRVRRGARARRSLRERRALLVRVAGEERLIAVEDAGRYRDALGVMPPGGLPEAFLEGGHDVAALSSSCASRAAAARSRPREANERFGRRRRAACCASSSARSKLVRGELRPGGTEREWCDPDVLRRLRRASLAALRREVEPAEQAALGRFLPRWHGIDRRATLREALVPLQGLSLPVSLWESEVLPRRVPGLPARRSSTSSARRARSSGSAPASTASRSTSARTRRCSAARRRRRAPEGEAHDAIRAALGASAEFWHDLARRDRARGRGRAAGALGARLGRRGDERRVDAAARRRVATRRRDRSAAAAPLLAPARGRDHGDAGPLVARRRGCSPGAPGPRARSRSSCSSGRASSRATASAAKASPAATAPSTASCARSRRSASAAAATSSKGSAARSSRCPVRSSGCASCAPREGDEPEPLVLAAADPAQPYGAALPWPKRAGARAARVAGAHVVLLGGEAALFVERGGRSLVPLREPEEELAPRRARGARRAREARRREAARGRALRRRAGRRDRGHAAARRGRLPRRPAPRRAARLIA